jgi:pyruvate dehydrogenase E2 component (dihydrolipoamide acetyltransferase)
MATVIIMPKQGQSVESCILTELKKKKGDKVDVGDILFSYETDKAAFDEEAKTEGTVLAIFFEEGDEIPVLTNVMVIGEEGENIDDLLSVAAAPGEIPDKDTESTAGVNTGKITDKSAANAPHPAEKKYFPPELSGTISPVSPRARVLAEKHAIRPETLKGSGPGGRVIEQDVQAAIDSMPKTTPLAKEIMRETGVTAFGTGTGLAGTVKGADVILSSSSADEKLAGTSRGRDLSGDNAAAVYGSPSEIKPLSNIRKLIAKAMFNSLHNSAQVTHHISADASNLLKLRKASKKAVDNGSKDNISINDMVCYATVKALMAFPNVNAHFLGDSIRHFSKVNLGLAVDTERGLMVPAVRNASEMTIQELSTQLKKVAAGCRKGDIDPDLLSPEAASLTISNLGNYGIEMFTPIINLPQVAILGVNTISPKPKDLGDGVYGFVPHIGLSLTYDHRAIDGGEASRFLKKVVDEIESLDFEL